MLSLQAIESTEWAGEGLRFAGFWERLQAVLKDVQSRPRISKPRSLIIELQVTPTTVQGSGTVCADVDIRLSHTLPDR